MAKKTKSKEIYKSFYDKSVIYKSKKFPLLEYIFNKYNPDKRIIPIIRFTLSDIHEAYLACDISEPTSISNTILDLTRKQHPVSYRLPETIYSLGYDLRKKTGADENGDNLAGEFVYVGVGKELNYWFKFPEEHDELIAISTNPLPKSILPFLRNDESAMFSVMDYLDVFSKIMHGEEHQVTRIQNPLKWQPNEIDGFYVGDWDDGYTLYPVETKALSTKDDINLVQMLGAIRMLHDKFGKLKIRNKKVFIQPIAARMLENEIHFAFFERFEAGTKVDNLNCVKTVRISLSPILPNWIL